MRQVAVTSQLYARRLGWKRAEFSSATALRKLVRSPANVFIEGAGVAKLKAGDKVKVTVEAAEDYDLRGMLRRS